MKILTLDRLNQYAIAVLFTVIAFIFRKLGECPMIIFRNYHLKRNTSHGLLDVL